MTQLMPLTDGDPIRMTIAAGRAALDGTLVVPRDAQGAVIFVHSGCASRLSPRSRSAARALGEAGFATLLVDLQTIDEEAQNSPAHHVAERLALISRRLLAATDQLCTWPETEGLPIGYLGIGAGAAAALLAAASRPEAVGAIALCSGMPDLANGQLGAVRAPTLLVVGGEDHALITRNQAALPFLPEDSALALIRGAYARGDAPASLDLAAPLAVRWFERFLC